MTTFLKSLLISLLFLNVSFTNGQESDTTKKKSKFFSVLLSPELTFRTLKSNAINKDLAQVLDSIEQPRFATAVSIHFGYQTKSNLRILAGLQVSDQGEQTKPSKTTETLRYKHHFYLLGLRCGFDYGVVKNKTRYFAAATVIPSYLIGSKEQLQLPNSDQTFSNTISQDYNAISVAAEVSAGFQWQVTETTQFNLSPYFRKSLSSVTSTELKKHFYSAGLNIGFVHFF